MNAPIDEAFSKRNETFKKIKLLFYQQFNKLFLFQNDTYLS